MSRRAVPLVALALGLIVVTAATADSTDPKVKISKADQAHANASILRFSDLGPAWTGGAEKPASLKIPVCPGYQPNDSDLTITGHAESGLTLSSAAIQVDTDVEIFKSPQQVAKLVKRVLQPLALDSCLRYDLLKTVGGQGVTIVGVSQLPVAKAGDDASLNRVTLSVKSNGKTVGVFSDFLYVSKGRTQFFVNIVSPGSLKSQLPSLENGIAKVLAGRAV